MAQAAKTRPAAEDKDKRDAVKVIAVNSKAYHDYLIRDTVEAGLVLNGREIKSIRAGKVNLREAYARVDRGELWLHNMHIAPYEAGDHWSPQVPNRNRKLLLHRTQINELDRQTRSKGLTLVPVRLYITRDRAKIELAVAQGKKVYDKRQVMAEKEAKRDIERAVRARGR
jgi:SsrA-binding protein